MESRFSPVAKIITLSLAIVLGLVLLTRVAHVLAPFLWAIVTAYILHPAINGLVRVTHLRRATVAVTLYFALMAGLVLAIVALFPIVRTQAIGLIGQIPRTVQAASSYFEQRFPEIVVRLELDTSALQRQLRDRVNEWTAAAPHTVLTVLRELVTFFIELFVYLVATFYLMLQGHQVIGNLRRVLPVRYHREFNRLVDEINTTLGAYLRGQLLLVAIMSASTYIALTILGVQYAVILALATGVLELIPILGPWSAGTIAVSVAALQPVTSFGWSNATLCVVVAIVYFVLRQLEDNLIIPTLIGRIVKLHPLLMIFILLVGTKIGGMLGLLLAVPTAAVLKIVFRYLYGKMTAEDDRRIFVLDNREALTDLLNALPGLANRRVVLLPQPGLLAWDDLPLVQRLAQDSGKFGVPVTVVTHDPIAASLTNAVGLSTTSIPSGASGMPETLAHLRS